MPTIPEALVLALRRLQAGRSQDAEQICRQILCADPTQPDSLYLLGLIAYRAGRYDAAVNEFQRAISANGNAAELHHALAKAYHAQRLVPEAVLCYRRAIALMPDLSEAHNNLGVALRGQGHASEAAECFWRALELKPDGIEALNNLGNALRDQGRLDDAAAAFRRAVDLAPSFAPVHNNLALVLNEQGRAEEAIVHLETALKLNPAFTEAHRNLGLALRSLGRLGEAIAAFQRAIDLKPDFAEAHNDLGSAHCDLGGPDEGMLHCRRAIELSPDFIEAHVNLGNALGFDGKLEDAAASFRRALEIRPESHEAHFNLGVTLLLLGQYEEGWPQFESRLGYLGVRKLYTADLGQKPPEGAVVLVHFEGGFGDTLHFLRYAELVRERMRAERVILACQPVLSRLLAGSVGDEMEIVEASGAPEGPLPASAWTVSLMSLPLALRLFEPLPLSRPNLRADPALQADWRDRLGARTDLLRVGFAWKGSPGHQRDRARSIPWKEFQPLLSAPGCKFYSLQFGADVGDRAAVAAAGVIDFTSEISDFADTAALASELDLIISVDTSLVHLAGGLGLPVWTLLPFVPDWRWGMHGESTPWYPTMRLFRQPARGDWDSVLQSIRAELKLLAEA